MKNATAILAEGHAFISKEKIALIHELKDMCFFSTAKERKNFLILVAASAGVDKIEEIEEANFGSAYLTAIQILHRIGADVFRKRRNFFTRNLDGMYEE